MLRLWIVCIALCVNLWGTGHSKQVIQEQRTSPIFQDIYRAHQKEEQAKRNVMERAWNKVKNFALPSPATREYDLFTWWWVQQCVRNPSLDPTGAITLDLLTNATGFKGWHNASNNPEGVEVDKLKLYESAVFLFYWHHYNMQKPTKGPLALSRLWKVAQDKQCLWIEPHFVDPADVDTWLKTVTPDGWGPEQKTLEEAIDEKFTCRGTLVFDKTIGQKWLIYYGAADEVKKWLGTTPYFTLFTAFKSLQEALQNDDVPLNKQREWLRSTILLSKVLSINDVNQFLKNKDASYLGCLNMIHGSQEEITVEDVHNFREFLRTFDPDNVDIEKNWKYIRWLNVSLFLGFQHKWQAICGDKEKKLDADGATNPVVIFKMLYDEEAVRGLWPAASSEHFPYIPIFLSLTSHGDIDLESPVYKAALVRTLRRGYDLHFVSGLKNFLLDYLQNIVQAPEGDRSRYVVKQACRIGEKDFQKDDVLEPEDVAQLTKQHDSMVERQDVKVHPYNIWQDPNPDVVHQRVSMAVDFLFAKDVWPEDYAMGLVQRTHKMAMMLLVYQSMKEKVSAR